MTATISKQADLSDTLSGYWDSIGKYQPGVVGALGGAALGGLGDAQARPGENPRQRALRITRNALLGGALGGVGGQLLGQGTAQAIKAQTGGYDQPDKPGFFSSIPARAAYVGSLLGASRWNDEGRRLKALSKYLPTGGLGYITFNLHPSEIKDRMETLAETRARSIQAANGDPAAIAIANAMDDKTLRAAAQTVSHGPTQTLDMGNYTGAGNPVRNLATAADIDKTLTHAANTYPKSFPSLLEAIGNQAGSTERKKLLDTHLLSYLDSRYSKGPWGLSAGPEALDRGLNFIGRNFKNPVARGIGRVGSLATLAAGALAPDIINGISRGDGSGAGIGGYMMEPGVAGTAQPTTWVDQLLKGRTILSPTTPKQ